MIEPLLPTRQKQYKVRFPHFILLAVASLFCIFAYQQDEAAISNAQEEASLGGRISDCLGRLNCARRVPADDILGDFELHEDAESPDFPQQSSTSSNSPPLPGHSPSPDTSAAASPLLPPTQPGRSPSPILSISAPSVADDPVPGVLPGVVPMESIPDSDISELSEPQSEPASSQMHAASAPLPQFAIPRISKSAPGSNRPSAPTSPRVQSAPVSPMSRSLRRRFRVPTFRLPSKFLPSFGQAGPSNIEIKPQYSEGDSIQEGEVQRDLFGKWSLEQSGFVTDMCDAMLSKGWLDKHTFPHMQEKLAATGKFTSEFNRNSDGSARVTLNTEGVEYWIKAKTKMVNAKQELRYAPVETFPNGDQRIEMVDNTDGLKYHAGTSKIPNITEIMSVKEPGKIFHLTFVELYYNAKEDRLWLQLDEKTPQGDVRTKIGFFTRVY